MRTKVIRGNTFKSDKALVDMTMIGQRGSVSDEQLNNFLASGFTRRNIYVFLRFISLKILSNYANHLTEPEPEPN